MSVSIYSPCVTENWIKTIVIQCGLEIRKIFLAIRQEKYWNTAGVTEQVNRP